MSDIKERLDKVRALIQEPEFLEGKGLSNEVNIRIFCYEPENEMVVRHFVNQLETDQSLDCHLIVCNLYKIFLSAMIWTSQMRFRIWKKLTEVLIFWSSLTPQSAMESLLIKSNMSHTNLVMC